MRFRVVSTAASLLAVAPGVSLALGLGEIHLRSTLNAPLNADIELIATAEELTSLRAQMASRDAFSRSGLEYPAFLAGIQVRPERLADGRTVIRLTSSVPMTEPFAILLVEVSTDQGRLQHVYTVLFDPPTFAPAAAVSAPVVAPVAGAGNQSAPIARPVAPAPVTPVPVVPAPAAVSRPAAVSGGAAAGTGEYVVRGGDSLSAIARKQYGTAEAERAMIAIYRGNQNAFEGNINRLRAGAVLRLPDNAAVTAVDPREASAEVRRQAASWSRSESTTAVPEAASDPRLHLVPPAAPGGAGASADAKALQDKVSTLEAELTESRRLLELRNAEIARLNPGAAPAGPPAPPAPGAAGPVVAPAPAGPAPAPVVEKPKPAPAPVVKNDGPSLIERLGEYWQVLAGGLLVLLLAVVGVRAARRRRSESADSLEPFAVAPMPVRDTSSDTLPLRKPFSDAGDPILVEESGTHDRQASARQNSGAIERDDSAASMSVPALDSTVSLDQGDPLAEADFHMAYGLYDQAADLVRLAIQREPARRDLKFKLLEVFFVWGNKDQFLQAARELSETRDASGPGEWEKVVIMGRQLAPEDALFSQSRSGSGASAASVDLNLEGGQNLVDFDLQGEPSVSLTSDGGVDLDLNTSLHGSDAPDGLGGLDFVLDDPGRGGDLAPTSTTRQLTSALAAVDGPTVEQPALDDIGDTLVGKLDAHAGFGGAEQTAELSLDDLGLDLGKFDVTGTSKNLLDDSQLTRALESADVPTTMLASLDDTSVHRAAGADSSSQPTELLPLADFDASGATSRLTKLEVDFDLDADAETGRHAAPDAAGFSLDLDVGAANQAEPEKNLEPVTMSEVGTKLDLARAYMDMGDPDGARSILGEVLQEGSANQRQEAQRLIDSIPG